MCLGQKGDSGGVPRRDFLKTAGLAGAAFPAACRLGESSPIAAAPVGSTGPAATVMGAFIYPPTEELRRAGYWSWPGSSFDPEGRQKVYMKHFNALAAAEGVRLIVPEKPLSTAQDVAAFVARVRKENPDGLLLVPFKKGHWGYVLRIIEETKLPAVVLATLGVLLVDHIRQLHRRNGAYLISSLDNFDAVRWGVRMIAVGAAMRKATIVNIQGERERETRVPHLGTRIKTIPLQRFYSVFRSIKAGPEVRALAESYKRNARKIVQPTDSDILEAAKTYFALKRIVEEEEAEALMMDCLPGLRKPHKHPPPCMGFMSLRDEGIPAGCQADLDATLTLLLVQKLFGKPGFQQNASMETEANHYFGAHCTCASKLAGPDAPPQPYILMSHAEAGWGCVPRVLWEPGWEVTMARYLSGKKPRMYVYTGKVVRCPPIPPTGGCRTNVELVINEVQDACDVKGMHQIIFHGNYGRQLRTFCRLYSIAVEI